jgi:hypothetical protein
MDREVAMAHHKRRRPKNRRAGCLLCKPHKANGIGSQKRAEYRSDRQWMRAEAGEREQRGAVPC